MEFIEKIPGNRVRCTLTSHEMPDSSDVIDKYLNGSRFQNAYKVHEIMRKFSDHFDDKGPFLICKLTNRSVTKAAISLDKHVTGKRFRKAFQRFEAGELVSPAANMPSTHPKNEISLEDGEECSNSSEASENSYDSSGDSEQMTGEKFEANLDSDDAYDFNVMDTDDMPNVTSSKRKLEVNGEHKSEMSKKPRKF